MRAGVVQWQNATFPKLSREFDSLHPLHAPVAQRIEQGGSNAKVGGSIPFGSANSTKVFYSSTELEGINLFPIGRSF